MTSTRSLIRRLCLPVAFGLLTTAAGAASLASYQFGTNLDYTTKDASVTATALGGTGTSRSSNSYAFQYPTAGNAGFMEFTVTAATGYLLDLNQINFAYYFAQSSGTVVPVTATFALQYSLDGFATSGIALTSPQASYASTSGAIDSSIVIGDFSAASYDLTSIPDSASVSFRIILTNNGSLNTSGYRYAIDNLLVDGAVVADPQAVPEPSSYALWAGAAVVGLVAARRRAR